MKIFNFPGKVVANSSYLQSQLRDAGFIAAVPLDISPGIVVCVDDSSPDPTNFVNAYTDPPVIVAVAGVKQANGVDKVTVTIQAFDAITKQQVSWNGTLDILQIMPQIPVSLMSIPIVNGQGSFDVGPTVSPGEYTITLQIHSIMISRIAVSPQFE